MDQRSFKINLLLIVLAALLLRVVCALPVLLDETSAGLIRPDTYSYMLPARALLSDGAMMTGPSSETYATTRPPGYIMILALFFRFSDLLWIPSLANCLFSALSCYPVGLCAMKLTSSRKAAYISAGLFALNLSSIANSPLILADAVLGLCCAWALYYGICAFRSRENVLWYFLASCLALGAGCYMKPVCTPLLLGGMPFLAVVFFAKQWRKVFSCFGIVAAVYLVLLLPVMIRNYRVGAEFDMDSNRGEMLYHSGSAILGYVTGENTGIIRARLRRESERNFAAHKEEFSLVRTRNMYNHKRYLALIRQYPAAFFMTHLPQWTMLLPDLPTFLENNHLTLTGRGTLDVMRQKGIFKALDHYLSGRYFLVLLPLPFLLATLLLYAASGMMILCLIKKRHIKALLFCCVFGFYLLFAGGPVTMPRYQIPALGLFCVLAGEYVILLYRKYRFVYRKNPR